MREVIQLKPRINVLMQEKVAQYRKNRMKLKQLKEQQDALSEELKEYMAEGKKITDSEGLVLAELIKRNGSSFDKKSLANDNPGLIEHYTTKTVSYSLKVN